jgi:hypothetical protein
MGTDSGVWVRIDGALKRLAPVFLSLLLLYLYSSLVSPVMSAETLRYVESTIITYFVSELVVKYVVTDNYRQFLRDYWFDIVLLVPFFSSLKLLGAAGKALKSVKGLKYVKYVQKGIKVPKILRKTRFFSDDPEKKAGSKRE